MFRKWWNFLELTAVQNFLDCDFDLLGGQLRECGKPSKTLKFLAAWIILLLMRAPRNLHHHSWRQRTSWTIGQTQNCPGNDLSPAGPREQSKIEKASSPFPSLQSQSSLSQPISKLSCSWPFARRYTERLKIQYNFHIKLILFWLQDHHHHNHSLCQRSSSWRRPGGFWNSGCTRAPASLRTSPSSSVSTLPKMAMLMMWQLWQFYFRTWLAIKFHWWGIPRV